MSLEMMLEPRPPPAWALMEGRKGGWRKEGEEEGQ